MAIDSLNTHKIKFPGNVLLQVLLGNMVREILEVLFNAGFGGHRIFVLR
jgi:hypothetical protein